MVGKTVRVVARIVAKPDKVEELRSVLLDLVGPTRKEAGCISYQLLQNKSDPADFTCVEEWASDPAIDAHFTTPHLHEALSKASSLLASDPDIRRYFIIG
jgi:quinol monooxygenase YgiN